MRWRWQERLKDTTRHCYTQQGPARSVAEHCWMVTLMAYFLRDEFPEAGHGQGDENVPDPRPGRGIHRGYSQLWIRRLENERTEERLLREWVDLCRRTIQGGDDGAVQQMDARQTQEAKIYKALDNLEAVIQHNFSELSTWIPGSMS